MKTPEQIADEVLNNLGHGAHDHRTLAGFDCVRVTQGRRRHTVCVYKNKRLVCPPLEFPDSPTPEVWKITEQYISGWMVKGA